MEKIILINMLICEFVLILTSTILKKTFKLKTRTDLENHIFAAKKDQKKLIEFLETIQNSNLSNISYIFMTGANTFYFVLLLIGFAFVSTRIVSILIFSIIITKIAFLNKEQSKKFETYDILLSCLIITGNFVWFFK